jgi:hypothetical protein
VLDSFQDAYILYLNISESRTHLIIGDIWQSLLTREQWLYRTYNLLMQKHQYQILQN